MASGLLGTGCGLPEVGSRQQRVGSGLLVLGAGYRPTGSRVQGTVSRLQGATPGSGLQGAGAGLLLSTLSLLVGEWDSACWGSGLGGDDPGIARELGGPQLPAVHGGGVVAHDLLRLHFCLLCLGLLFRC